MGWRCCRSWREGRLIAHRAIRAAYPCDRGRASREAAVMHVIARARIRAAKKRWPQAASAREAWDRSMTVSETSDVAGMKSCFRRPTRSAVFMCSASAAMKYVSSPWYNTNSRNSKSERSWIAPNTARADGRRKTMRPRVGEAVEHRPHVAPLLTMPNDQKDYDRLVQAMDQILARIGEDAGHPLALLASRMGALIDAYDEARRPVPQVTGAAALRAIRSERDLGRGDRPEAAPDPSSRRSRVGNVLSMSVRPGR